MAFKVDEGFFDFFSEAHSEPSQTSKIKHFVKIYYFLKFLSQKLYLIRLGGFEYVSAYEGLIFESLQSMI